MKHLNKIIVVTTKGIAEDNEFDCADESNVSSKNDESVSLSVVPTPFVPSDAVPLEPPRPLPAERSLLTRRMKKTKI